MDDTEGLAGQLEEKALLQQQQQKQQVKGKKAKEGGKEGGGGGGGQKREKDISRALSRLLRHQAVNAGIHLDKEGYAPLDKVLQWGPLRSLHVSVKDVFDVTADNEKQRFSLKPSAAHPDPNSGAPTTTTVPVEAADASHWLIRANQGHSIPLESQALLRPISLDAAADAADTADAVPVPPVVVHGTYFAFWEAIVASGGLRCMGRNHVHCSTGVPGAIGGGGGQEGGAGASASAVISGMRGDAELLVYLDVRRSLEDGAMSWWVSENGVVLTEGVGEDGLVPAKYFKEVVGRKVDVGVLWKDGELVKELELPEGVQMRAPPGKGPRGGRGGRGGGRGGRGGRGRGRGRGEA